MNYPIVVALGAALSVAVWLPWRDLACRYPANHGIWCVKFERALEFDTSTHCLRLGNGAIITFDEKPAG